MKKVLILIESTEGGVNKTVYTQEDRDKETCVNNIAGLFDSMLIGEHSDRLSFFPNTHAFMMNHE